VLLITYNVYQAARLIAFDSADLEPAYQVM
jgi:hypothetical protein